LRNARSIYIATHISPDGDAIGSAVGLAWVLQAIGKTCTVVCADPVPPSLRFIPGAETVSAQPPTDQDLIVIVDTGDVARLGRVYTAETFAQRPIINIDHHLTNAAFGTLNVIDPQAAAVGEMIFTLAQALGVAINPTIATCLLAAIVTDTIGFRTSSTTPQTLHVASVLVQAGAPLSEIVQQSFESRPLPVLRVWGHVLSTFTVHSGLAWASLPNAVLRHHGAKEDDVKGLVNVLRGTEGVLVSTLLMESADGRIKVEFRSNGKVNVADIAATLGGGGHKAASGCTLPGPLAEAERRVLAEVRKRL
jgi:phosphoesterase RecJ-like protein